ncbi:hypothetical protein L1987_45316 [Smallanthus sonchifolius]|uniref:Uncharacterized protein n=1 Tax=Smallanthus sonchifolius TaxID=185202 RepID=A0ACB9GRW8_9ASTR|nr:hypothetical protein L1987_45316 [Smallanthus sonchifolius]
MEEDGEDQTPRSPFWIQTTTNRRGLSSLFFNSFVLIIFLLLFAVLSMVFIIPSLIDLSSNIFRPNLVKRSWDSINLVLVLVALLFGFLSRNISNDEKLNFDNEAPIIMYDLQDQSVNSAIGLRRQRTSVSYPDLRELSPPWNHRAVDPWRFSDDTHLNYYLESNRNSFRQRNRREYNFTIQDVENHNFYTPPPQPPSPSQKPAIPVKQKTKRVYRNVAIDDGDRSSGSGTGKMLSLESESSEQKGGRDEKRRARSSEPRKILSPVIDPFPEPTSPPPDSPLTERKRNDGNATKDFYTSFYHKKKKKRQRDRSVDNLGALLHHSQPPAGKFQPPAPPPLPAPPRTAKFAPRAAITRVAPFITDKPGTPFMTTSFNGIEDSSSGGESPMKQIPPPPPLPPFKMPDWKFAVEGDFVRLQSTLSSRSASPDGDEARSPSSDVDTTAAAALFCPRPDVDTKADSFIAKFRAGLKLERMSKLGPGPGSGPIDN